MADFIQKTMRIRIEFTEPILGAVPKDEEIYTSFIASKAPDAETAKEEIERIGVTDMVDKGTTGFLMDDEGEPVLSEHVIKGFLSGTAKALRRIPGKTTESSKMAAYDQKIKTLIFIYPRFIKLVPPADVDEDDILKVKQRPLRASTPQGERTALASSETMPAGTTAEFEIQLMDKTHEKWIREMLDYGRYAGLGQWRNAGYGRFEWMEITE